MTDKDEQLNRFELAAKAVSLAGPGLTRGKNKNAFKCGAIIVNRKTIIASRFNSYKTHPQLIKFTQYPFLHAEQAAILSYGIAELRKKKGIKLYIARTRKDRNLALAKPCSVCQAMIDAAGIKEVYYSTKNGNFLRLI